MQNSHEFRLLNADDARLRLPCRPVTGNDNIEPVVAALKKICAENDGAGLAANQIGSDLRIFVLAISGMQAYINPEILEYGDERPFLGEGCLSFPGEVLCTSRYHRITVRADNCEEKALTELEAVAFQHELDHLDGITMHKRSIK